MTTLLERPAVTELYTELETTARLTSVAGGIQDNSITIIENPLASGFTGFLLSERLTRGRDELIPQDVSHYRVNQDNTPKLIRTYDWARVMKGFDRRPYNFVLAQGFVLPCPNTRLYEVRFITPGDFFSVRAMLGDNPSTAQRGVQEVYRLVAEKSSIFSMNDGKLAMPADYASFRIGR